jgi:RNA polymerase sigma factor (sigma-70 family)
VKSLSDQQLLREYFERQSEPAFTEFVHRHVDLVYSCALRMVRDPQLAEDVTQTVFAGVARNAPALAEHPVVLGWLHRTAQNIAANIVRQEVRRREREEKATVMNEAVNEDAWERIEPHIEEALATLKEEDRDVVLMRFFQSKSAREIAAVIGTTEEAAQRRLNRAVDRIRKFLSDRSIGIGAASLGVVLSTRAISAAPLGLADVVCRSVAQAAVTQIATATATQGILMTTTQKALLAISLAVAVGTGVYEVHRSTERQREARSAAQIVDAIDTQLQAMRRERDTARKEIEALRNESSRLKNEAAEVHRLRRDVSELRGHVAKSRMGGESGIEPTETALIAWLNRTDLFKQAQYRLPDKAIPELALLTEEDWLQMAKQAEHALDDTFQGDDAELNRRVLKVARERAKMKFGFLLSGALDRYRKGHNDLLPSDITLLRPYFRDREAHLGGSAEFVSDAMLQRYEVLQTGNFEDVPKEKAVILGEVAPADPGLDTRLVIGKHWLQTAEAGDAGYWDSSARLTFK